LDKPLLEPPYNIFTLAKKKQLVYMISAAAIFSLFIVECLLFSLGPDLKGVLLAIVKSSSQ